MEVTFVLLNPWNQKSDSSIMNGKIVMEIGRDIY
jgi:hypothetical protein